MLSNYFGNIVRIFYHETLIVNDDRHRLSKRPFCSIVLFYQIQTNILLSEMVKTCIRNEIVNSVQLQYFIDVKEI